MWTLLQSLIISAVVASNIHWHGVPNGYHRDHPGLRRGAVSDRRVEWSGRPMAAPASDSFQRLLALSDDIIPQLIQCIRVTGSRSTNIRHGAALFAGLECLAARARQEMRAHPFLTNLPLSNEDVEVLVAAYKDALRGLGVGPSEDRVKKIVATKAIEMWQTGVRDRAKLTDAIFEGFLRLPPHHSAKSGTRH